MKLSDGLPGCGVSGGTSMSEKAATVPRAWWQIDRRRQVYYAAGGGEGWGWPVWPADCLETHDWVSEHSPRLPPGHGRNSTATAEYGQSHPPELYTRRVAVTLVQSKNVDIHKVERRKDENNKTVPKWPNWHNVFQVAVTTLIRLSYTSTVRRSFDCLSEVIKVTLSRSPASRCHADLSAETEADGHNVWVVEWA